MSADLLRITPDEAAPALAAERFGLRAAGGEAFDSARIVPIRHGFHRHPLVQPPQLALLARELTPTRQCRCIAPGTRQQSEFFHTGKAHDGRSVEQVFEQIEVPGSWVALYNVETVPRYRDILAEVMAGAAPLLGGGQPGIFNVGGFIFVSAPPSVTPFHIDRENSFWLQIAGRKTMSVWDDCDREVVAARDVEDFIVGRSLKRVRLADAARSHAREFDVGPGDGVYFPATSPHATRTTNDRVRPGDGVSVSIGVVFHSDVTRAHARVHRCIRVLRRIGFDPLPPGRSAWRDRLKAPVGRLAAAAFTRWRGYVPPPGAC